MYEQLVAALGGRKAVPDRATLISSRASTWTKAKLNHALREARKFELKFRGVRAHPFCRNARHTADDLALLAGAYRGVLDHRLEAWSDVDECIHRLRQGIVWVFARHELEMEVLFPLSFLLADISDSGVMAKKSVGGSSHEHVAYEPPDTNARISEIAGRIESIHARIARMPQHALQASPSRYVIPRLAEALQYLDQRDLKKAKRKIEAALSHL
jgi:hypothetical protein